ncbi:MAG: bifunctional riboflavin kinase/FAD synthetase, partial [Pseudomonadota bacterium]|nr:bifunctional riboflavin kinase/FAD synthetase [Pseudomonadota bacterium]
MKLIRGAYNIDRALKGSVATIGNFDGVHRGHQAVIAQVQARAKALNAPTTAIIFEPQPAEFFAKEQPPTRIFPLRDKLRCLKVRDIDQVVCLPFNAALAAQSPEQFIEQYLVEGLAIQHLVIGDDFRFGAKRAGDFATLTAAGEQHGFTVEDSATVTEADRRISSTWVREALAAHDLAQAEFLLGKPYKLSGRVAHGEKLGRTLGFPTLNLVLPAHNFPLKGVFAVKVHGLDDEVKLGVANLGYRPSVSRGETFNLEVHVLDFEKMVYGKHILVEILHFLRDEQKFGSLMELQKGIAKDIRSARAYFSAL